MPVYKATLLFSHLSGASTPNLPVHRTGGWSESWYTTASTLQGVINLVTQQQVFGAIVLPGLASLRSQLLPLGSAIVGIRIQTVSPLGPTQSLAVSFPGISGNLANTPQTALLCKIPSLGTNNIRRAILRGVPGGQVVEGEAQLTASYQASLNAFFGGLSNWQFRGRDLSQPVYKIVNITVGTTTVITFETAVTFNVLDFVRVLKSRDTTGALRGGRFQVTAIGPGNNNITIANWPYTATTGGSGRKDGVIYANVDANNCALSRVIIKKVGRPFVQYRGRRSRRR